MGRLSTKLQELYNQIDNKKTKLNTLRPLSSEQIINLKKVYDVDMTYHSNAIEGNTLTYSETKLVLQEGITISGKSVNEHLEVINHKEAIDFIEELATSSKKEINLNDIMNLHYLILKSINSKEAGKFRTCEVGVKKTSGDIYRFVEPLHITQKMQEFIEWLNKTNDIHPVLKATLAHYRFVSIHPFIDGNGRCSRLLMNLILIQNGYVPAVIKVDDRSKYINALEIAQNKDELEEFSIFIASCVDRNFDFYFECLENNIKFI